ncbi:MAG: hypothetical protein M3388_10790, partial [Acidobacteriota bacterium]|nr:hypothetical protein [Acidobacteriota bacterium]
ETLRPAHITPLFKWKFDLAFEEAGFEYVWEGYNRISYRVGDNKTTAVAPIHGNRRTLKLNFHTFSSIKSQEKNNTNAPNINTDAPSK